MLESMYVLTLAAKLKRASVALSATMKAGQQPTGLGAGVLSLVGTPSCERARVWSPLQRFWWRCWR